jgi:hypothetical protein
MLEQMGIFPDRYVREKRPALRSVIKAVIATIRMQKFKQQWAVSKELRRALEEARRKSSPLTASAAAGRKALRSADSA